jgi:hypothetical protein
MNKMFKKLLLVRSMVWAGEGVSIFMFYMCHERNYRVFRNMWYVVAVRTRQGAVIYAIYEDVEYGAGMQETLC